jgi:hypothetical protein
MPIIFRSSADEAATGGASSAGALSEGEEAGSGEVNEGRGGSEERIVASTDK